MISQFIDAMMRYVPSDARIMATQFRGNPADDIKGRWRAKVLDNVNLIDNAANVYLCVSAMGKNERGEWRRRKENFVGGLLLMIDDLGDGPGAKFPLSTLAHLKPTALIETSPSNFQAVYMFDSLVRDMSLFDSLIKAFIAAQFLGQDTGMAGVNRVFRPPAGINGKPKHGGWRVRCAEWRPEARYSVVELAEAFGLRLSRKGPPIPRGATVDKAQAIRAFIDTRSALRMMGMLKSEQPDLAGWTDVVCPWTEEHTDAKNNGAAICIPNDENGYHGGFKCFHGSCAERGWRELTDWIADQHETLLDLANQQAHPWHHYRHDR